MSLTNSANTHSQLADANESSAWMQAQQVELAASVCWVDEMGTLGSYCETVSIAEAECGR